MEPTPREQIETLREKIKQIKSNAAEQGRLLTDNETKVIGDMAAFAEREEHKMNMTPEAPLTRPGMNYADAKTGFTILNKADRLATEPARPWIGDFCRNTLGLKPIQNIAERDSATVPLFVSTDIIDAIRSKSRVVQAGARTFVISGPTNFPRITGDVTVHQHVETVDDITTSVPTWVPVITDPKALVAQVPLSMELLEDSVNIDAILNASIAASFAKKIDQLAITKLLADTGIPTSASAHACTTWDGVMLAVGAALGQDQDLPFANICNATDYITRHGERVADGLEANGAWLGTPGLLQGMVDMPTSHLDAGFGFFGDFARAVGIVVRRELRLEIVRWQQPGTASHLLIAHSRIEPYIFSPAAVFKQRAVIPAG